LTPLPDILYEVGGIDLDAPNTTMKAVLERRTPGIPGDLGWQRVGSEMKLAATSSGFKVTWSGVVPLPEGAADDGDHRILITEIETFPRDLLPGDPNSATSRLDFVRERIVFADAFDLWPEKAGASVVLTPVQTGVRAFSSSTARIGCSHNNARNSRPAPAGGERILGDDRCRSTVFLDQGEFAEVVTGLEPPHPRLPGLLDPGMTLGHEIEVHAGIALANHGVARLVGLPFRVGEHLVSILGAQNGQQLDRRRIGRSHGTSSVVLGDIVIAAPSESLGHTG
jgi:hypothetical protein